VDATVQLKRKLKNLEDALLSYGRVIVAYSGGVDSSFLLKSCAHYLGNDKVTAITAVSPTYTRKELKTAGQIAKELGVAHKIIRTDEASDPRFKANPENRCYYCKSELFSKLKSIAKRKGAGFVLDGTNADDLRDYRPGRQAKEELGVRSPLAEAGLTKDDIRVLSKEFGLSTWDAPQAACLASRFAYGQEITVPDLKRIGQAEDYIRSLGIKMVRVRHYKLPDSTKLARIEVDGEEIEKVTGHKSQVTGHLKKLGYNYVTLDLEGYRSGSMNESIKKKRR
jgi:uncharacterized protein